MSHYEIKLSDREGTRKFKGPKDTTFELQGLRKAFREHVDFLPLMGQLDPKKDTLFPLINQAFLVPATWSKLSPESTTHIYEMDHYEHAACQRIIGDFDNIELHLEEDLPESTTCEQAVLIVESNSERLLMFEMIERLNMILPDGSTIFVIIPKRREKDFVKKLQKHLRKPQVMGQSREGCTFRGLTRKDKNKWTERRAEFVSDTFTDEVQLSSRPGVFCHGREDQGGKVLAECVELEFNQKVLELGAGCGTTGLLLAQSLQRRADGQEHGTTIRLVDSHIRATESAKRNIEANGFDFVTTELQHNFKIDEGEEEYDVVVGNPPYYANNRIADYFIRTASQVLKINGKVYIVSKHGETMEEMMQNYGFVDCSSSSRKNYEVTVGTLAERPVEQLTE